MGRRNSLIDEGTKAEIANELGVYDIVKKNGWREVSSRDCGNIVKKALERSERAEKRSSGL